MPPPSDALRGVVEETQMVKPELATQAQLSQAQPSQIQPSQDGFHDSALEDDNYRASEETHGPDVYGSVIDETPYQDIELDTQAQPDSPDTPSAMSQAPHGLPDASAAEFQSPHRLPEGHGLRAVTPTPLFSRLLMRTGPSPEFKFGRAPDRPAAQNFTRFPKAMQQPLAESGKDSVLSNMAASVQLTLSAVPACSDMKSQTPRTVPGPEPSVSLNNLPTRESTLSVPDPASSSVEAHGLPLALSEPDTVTSNMTPPVHPKTVPEEVPQSSVSISRTVASQGGVRSSSRRNFTGFICSPDDDSAPTGSASRSMNMSPALIPESLQHEIVSDFLSAVKNTQDSNANRLPQSTTTGEGELTILDSARATLNSGRQQNAPPTTKVTNKKRCDVQDSDQAAPSVTEPPKQKPMQELVPKFVQMNPPQQIFGASSLTTADPVLLHESTATTKTAQKNPITNPHDHSVAPRKTTPAVKSNQARPRRQSRREQGKYYRATAKVVGAHLLCKLPITSKEQLQNVEPVLAPMGPILRSKPFTDVVSAQPKSARLDLPPHEVDVSVMHPAVHPANNGRRRVSTAEPSNHGDINPPCTPEHCAAGAISNGADNQIQQGYITQNTPKQHEFTTDNSHGVEEDILGVYESDPGQPSQNSTLFIPNPVLNRSLAIGRNFEYQEQGPRLSSQPLNETCMEEMEESSCSQGSKLDEQGQYPPSQTSNEIDMEEMNENYVLQDPQPDELSLEISRPQSQSNSPHPSMREDQPYHGQGSRNHSQLPRSESRRSNTRGIDGQKHRQEFQQLNSGHQIRHIFRPQSSQSNMGAPMSSRPVRKGEMQPSRNSTPAMNIPQTQKIRKSTPGKKKTPAEAFAVLLARQKAHEAEGNELRQVIQEAKLEAMEFSKNQKIKSLEGINARSMQTISSLQKVQGEQKNKLIRWGVAGAKYREHINNVVRDHEYLTAEALRLKQLLKEAKSEVTLRIQQDIALQSLIETQRKAEEAAMKSKQKQDKIYSQIKENSENLAAQVSKLAKSEELLQKSTAELKHQLEVETKKAQGFEKQILAVKKGREEFDEILKEIPSSVAKELVKKDGIFAKLLLSGDATQAKFDEVIASVNSFENTNVEPSPALEKALGDFFTKLESKLPPPIVEVTPEPPSRTVDDLKEYFNQYIHDRLAQENLNRKLSELETKNTALLDDKKLQELALQNLTNEKEKLDKELENEKRNLEEKTREFENLQTNPPEDSVLVSKVRDLESKYSAAQQRVDAAAQDAAKDKQELATFKESIAHQKGEIEQLGRTIKMMKEGEEKKDEASRISTQKLREDFEKLQLATKNAMQQEHQLELKIYEQKRVEAESALSQSRKEIEQMNGEHDKTRAERDKYKGYARDQDVRLQHAEQKRPGIEDSQSLQNRMQAAEDGIAASRRQFLCVAEIFTKQNEFNSERYKDFSKEIKSMDQLERENEALTHENDILREKILKGQGKRQLQTRSDESPARSTPRRDVASNSDQGNLVQRAPLRLANRKASGPGQSSQNGSASYASRNDGAVFTNPQNVNNTTRRVEKSVTFSDEPTYEDSLRSASSPMVRLKANFSNLDSLFDESGILDPLRLKEYQKHNKSGQERVFLPTEAVTPSDHLVSKTSHTIEPVVDRRREGLQPKSALKPTSLRTDQSREPHTLKLSRTSSSQISKIVSGRRSTSYQANQTGLQESPRQGSSRRASMKRPAQSNVEPKSTKRRALSKSSSSKLGAINEVPDSQDAA